MDKIAPPAPCPHVAYVQCDILDPQWEDHIRSFNPDILIHLAFIVNPIHDEDQMEQVNIGGTKRTLSTALETGVGRILTASSATAYGAWPDNPLHLRETDPIRIHPSFSYARHKGILEHWYQEIRKDHPDLHLIVIRPAIVFGSHVNNFLSRFLFAFPVVPLVNKGQTPIQFVHEDDVALAILELLENDASGDYNLGADDARPLREWCELAGRPTINMSRTLLELFMRLGWALRLSRLEAPPGILDYFEFPWVVDSTKLKRELKRSFQYTSEDAFREMLSTRAK